MPEPGVYGGSYFVPVPEELEPYALFPLEGVRLEQQGQELTLRYDLPELLLGNARRVSFRGTVLEGEPIVLSGDDGAATCQPASNGWACDEVLRGIDVDTEKVERLLSSMPDDEARARLSVSERFAVDPIGVLRIDAEQ